MTAFTRFVAIDWSGAKGRRHKGIAVADAGLYGPPRLVRPSHVWSREEVLDWLLREAAKAPTLFGFDFSFAPPLIEKGEYLLGEPGVPRTAREFWAYVDARCDDEDLGAASFLETAHRRHFYFGIADGVKADFVRFRQCDARLNAQGGRKTASAYDAIGAAQVAKASFAGMRLLHRLNGKVAIWPRLVDRPMDRLPRGQRSRRNLYPHLLAARRNDRRQAAQPGRAQSRTGGPRQPADPPAFRAQRPPDRRARHRRRHAATGDKRAARLRSRGPNPQIARTEGWTFGVL